MTRLPISVCMISGAEEARIARSLESVAEWTQEIIVVLNEEVRDQTEAIATKYGARVYREPWKGHIAQKNSAAAKASQPWLLGLDADEVVSPELRDEIQRTLENEANTKSFAAFNFPRLSWYCGRWIRHGDWYPDRQTRLWRRGAAKWGGIDPHDKLLAEGNIGKLRGNLLHYSMEGMSDLVRKTMSYSDVFLREKIASGNRVSSLEVWIRPLWRLIRGYILRLGFLDGWQGGHIAGMGAFYTFVRYARVLEEQRRRDSSK